MSSEHGYFGDLADVSVQVRAWEDERDRAMLFVRSIGEERLFEAIESRLFPLMSKTGGGVPGHDTLMQILGGIPALFGLPKEGAEEFRKTSIAAISVSGALADLLINSSPATDLLSRVAKVEPLLLDISFIAARIANSSVAGAWLEFLRPLHFPVLSINDDEYRSSDELARWGREVRRPVPFWRTGDFPHRGMELCQLALGILRAVDEGAWLASLNALALPSMIEAVLWANRVERAPSKLLAWLRAAPPAYDHAGQRTEGALVFVLERKALGVIEGATMGRTAWGEDVDTDGALRATARARRELVAALSERADGIDLLAELSGRSLLMAEGSSSDSPRTALRHALYRELGLDYANALGAPVQALDEFMRRASAVPGRSHWGLWLAASACIVAAGERLGDPERKDALRRCWDWLRDLLVAQDAGITDRQAEVQSAASRAGAALASVNDPVAALDCTWDALATQRLPPRETRYKSGFRAASRLLLRAGYCAYRQAGDDVVASQIWRATMDMALSTWLSDPVGDAFGEVTVGLAHLASGARVVADEPRSTLEYLVGLPEEASGAIVALLDNKMPAEDVTHASREAGIDARAYVLLGGSRIKDGVRRAIAALDGVRSEKHGETVGRSDAQDSTS